MCFDLLIQGQSPERLSAAWECLISSISSRTWTGLLSFRLHFYLINAQNLVYYIFLKKQRKNKKKYLEQNCMITDDIFWQKKIFCISPSVQTDLLHFGVVSLGPLNFLYQIAEICFDWDVVDIRLYITVKMFIVWRILDQ